MDKNKGSYISNIDYIPSILALGIIAGFGSYTTLFGAFVLFVLFSFLNKKPLFNFGASCLFIAFVSSANVVLGGRSDTLFALLFITGLFVILFSFLKPENLIPKKAVSIGFSAACALSIMLLSFPFVLGKKLFSSIELLYSNGAGYFSNVNGFAVICALVTLTVYYYLSKSKLSFLPSSFLSVLAGAVVNFVYKMNLVCADSGFENFKYVADADFGKIFLLLFFGLLGGFLISSQSAMALISSNKTDKIQKPLILIGAINTVSSISGLISGGISNQKPQNKLSKNLLYVIDLIILILFVLFFGKIAPHVPLASAGAILFIKCFEFLAFSFSKVMLLNRTSKKVFLACFLTALYNVVWGLSLSLILAFIMKGMQNGKKN